MGEEEKEGKRKEHVGEYGMRRVGKFLERN